MFPDTEDAEAKPLPKQSTRNTVRQMMRAYLVMLVNHLTLNRTLAVGQKRRVEHDPYAWTSGALALLDSSLNSILGCVSNIGSDLDASLRLLVAMCVVTSVKFHSEYVDSGVLDVIYSVLPGDCIPDRRALSAFVQKYEIYLLGVNNVFTCLQDNAFSNAVRNLERMLFLREIQPDVLKICTKTMLFFYYQLGACDASDYSLYGHGLSVLVLACVECAEGSAVLPRPRVDERSVRVAKLFASHSQDMYTGTRITLGGSYMDALSRETSITCKANVAMANTLLQQLL